MAIKNTFSLTILGFINSTKIKNYIVYLAKIE